MIVSNEQKQQLRDLIRDIANEDSCPISDFLLALHLEEALSIIEQRPANPDNYLKS